MARSRHCAGYVPSFCSLLCGCARQANSEYCIPDQLFRTFYLKPFSQQVKTAQGVLCCAAGVRGGVGNKGLQALAAMTGLTNLDLDSRKISDAGLPALAPLTGLRRLDLFSARVTDAGCGALRRGMAGFMG